LLGWFSPAPAMARDELHELASRGPRTLFAIAQVCSDVVDEVFR